jgi:hypothetical protein
VPVLVEYKRVLEAKRKRRGLPPGPDVIDDASGELQIMLQDPFKWAHRWLAEFHDDPNDQTGVVLFADHCLRQYQAFQNSIEQTRPKNPG